MSSEWAHDDAKIKWLIIQRGEFSRFIECLASECRYWFLELEAENNDGNTEHTGQFWQILPEICTQDLFRSSQFR